MAARRLPNWLTLSPAVRAARRHHRPLVALETTVLTHGLPREAALPLVRELEKTVHRAGATPAFVALLAGKARVGLTPHELDSLVSRDTVAKCARADLGWLLSQKAAAGTTVSATLFIAAQAGIAVAATGGIGGVHRDAGSTFDISADLLELTRAPVTLVCSGPKIIVDLRKTLEFLESRSVPVIGYQTDELPGFFVRRTGLRLRAAARRVEELAAAVRSYRATGYSGGIVVVNPVSSAEALAESKVEKLVAQALRAAEKKRIRGAALTPFLLARMNDLSGGATMRANQALLRSNAELAARLAAALRGRRTRD
jgi:pseudouridine-5'-phosphate glycosidase